MCVGDAYDTYNRLHNQLLNKTMKYARPRLNMSETVDITVHIYLKNIENFDISSGTLSLAFTVHAILTDEYKIWNSSDYDGISATSIPKSTLWIPTVFIPEALSFATRYAIFNDGEDESVQIYNNGVVSYLRDTQVEYIRCDANVWKYPYDQYMCTLTLIPSTFIHEAEIFIDTPMFLLTMINNNSNWNFSHLSYENTLFMSIYSKVILRKPKTTIPTAELCVTCDHSGIT